MPATDWHLHNLAPGIRLYEGTTSDEGGLGRVRMHVLRVDVTQRGVAIRPLMRSLAQRAPLSQLAAGHKRVVAAVNTGYFDFVTGAPIQPLIANGQPLVLTSRPAPVVGIDADGRLESGSVSLPSKVISGQDTHKLRGLNDIAAQGLVVFSAAWGSTQVPTDAGSIARPVVRNRLGGAVAARGEPATVPNDGYLLLAHGRSENWLATLPTNAPINVTNRVVTTAPHPFVQAYGVGANIVTNGAARTGLACDSAGTQQPARTAIGLADDNTTLVIGEVEDHPGTRLHGLDEDQMGSFMGQLGVDQAWDLDGSGSTEMLARMPGTSTLSQRTYPADGTERAMPIGLGLTYTTHKASRSR